MLFRSCHAVYEQLIAADNALEAAARDTDDWLACERADFDNDGSEEVLVESARLSAYFHPRQGGGLLALEYRPKRFALGNVLGRRLEGYHQKLAQAATPGQDAGHQSIHEVVKVKEAGLEKRLVYDRLPRFSFLDHFLPDRLTLAEFREERFNEMGDFAGKPYAVQHTQFRAASGRVGLSREAAVWTGSKETRLRLEKVFSFSRARSGLGVAYSLTNLGEVELSVNFGIEFNLTLLAGEAPDRFYRINGHAPHPAHLASQGETPAVKKLELVDQAFGFQVSLGLAPAARLWRFPVETVSQSEAGFERTYQGSCLVLTWPLNLLPGRPLVINIQLDFQEL